jgi:hypothetical protein
MSAQRVLAPSAVRELERAQAVARAFFRALFPRAFLSRPVAAAGPVRIDDLTRGKG